jgi:hypothetical protein
MSHEEFENYLTLLNRMLQLRSGQSEAIAEELRLHLEERLGELTDRGVEPKKAVNIALGEFGDATALASKFTEISRMKRRRVMFRSIVTGVCAAIVGFAALMTIWPGNRPTLLDIAQAEPTQTKETTKKAADAKPPISAAERANQETRLRLEQKIKIEFFDEPLNEVVNLINHTDGIQFHFDKKAMEDSGIATDALITLQMKEVPVRVGLRFILKPLDLSYYLDNGIVMITTQEVVEQRLSVQMYNVKNLVGEDTIATPRSGDFPVPPGATSVQSNSDRLIDLIQSVAEPESWGPVGGPGSMSYYRGILVVRQTEAVHEKIDTLLNQLRYMLKDSPPTKNMLTIDPNQQPASPGSSTGGMGGSMPPGIGAGMGGGFGPSGAGMGGMGM